MIDADLTLSTLPMVGASRGWLAGECVSLTDMLARTFARICDEYCSADVDPGTADKSASRCACRYIGGKGSRGEVWQEDWRGLFQVLRLGLNLMRLLLQKEHEKCCSECGSIIYLVSLSRLYEESRLQTPPLTMLVLCPRQLKKDTPVINLPHLLIGSYQ